MESDASTVVVISVLAAVIPSTLYIAIIYWFDHYEKEPAWLLAALFIWGALPSIILAVIFNVIASAPFEFVAGPEIGDTLNTIFIAPPVEELVKAIALVGIFVLLRHEVDSLLDGIIYGAMVGMGFALVENIFYFVEVYEESGAEAWRFLVFLRGVLFGLNHSLFTSMTGLGLAVSRFTKDRILKVLAPFLGWMVAVAFHTIHNLGATLGAPYCLLLPFTDWGGIWLLFVIIIWALWQEKRWIRDYLKEEVAFGTLTLRQYETACSAQARLHHRIELLLTRGPRAYIEATRFYRQCSELAYKKHHFALLGEKETIVLTEELRAALSQRSHYL